MYYITIDGDDVGAMISSSYFANDTNRLTQLNNEINLITSNISDFLSSNGFNIIFSAADGVAAYSFEENLNFASLFSEIQKLAGLNLKFSMGVGPSLRDSYIGLLVAKSNGKNQFYYHNGD